MIPGPRLQPLQALGGAGIPGFTLREGLEGREREMGERMALPELRCTDRLRHLQGGDGDGGEWGEWG
ncbi:hypothetical protein DUI87_26054 [Hirundo rustica rustica]|uniref:Uncharacterized protein n=1 Tax=Hirundo rustica rustica TaxID=333673 RepID=A0A3M0JEN9_HIRRU|nr:hypothetical protein DUI87_26054 [Hirundo rustica rustica]